MSHPLSGIGSAAEALALYLHLTNGGGQVRSRDLFESREICARCGKGPRTTRGRHRTAICMACGQPWQGRVVPLIEPKPERRGRGGLTVKPKATKRVRVRREEPAPVEHAADMLLALRWIFEVRPQEVRRDPVTLTLREWRWDLRAFAVHCEGNGRSYATAALEGERMWPGETKSRWWSERKVRDAVATVRAVVERRLAAIRHGRLGWGGEGSAYRRRRGGSDSIRRASAG